MDVDDDKNVARPLAKPKIQPGPWRATVYALPENAFEFYVQHIEVDYAILQGPSYYHYANWTSQEHWTSDHQQSERDQILIHNLGQQAHVIKPDNRIQPPFQSKHDDNGNAHHGKFQKKFDRRKNAPPPDALPAPQAWITSAGSTGRNATVLDHHVAGSELLKLPPISKYETTQCYVKIYGNDAHGRTVLMRLNDWMPWITVELPLSLHITEQIANFDSPDAWGQYLCETVRPWDDAMTAWRNDERNAKSETSRATWSRMHWQYVMSQNFYGFVPSRWDPLVPELFLTMRVYAPNKAALSKLETYILDECGGRVHEFDRHSARISFENQVQQSTGIKPHSWVHVPQWHEPAQFLSHTQIEIETSWRTVRPHPERSDVPPLTRLSFDIECYDPKDEFPDATKPSCYITTIGFTLSRYNAAYRDAKFIPLEHGDVDDLDLQTDTSSWLQDTTDVPDLNSGHDDTNVVDSVTTFSLMQSLQPPDVWPDCDALLDGLNFPSSAQMLPPSPTSADEMPHDAPVLTAAHRWIAQFIALTPEDQYLYHKCGRSLRPRYGHMLGPRALAIFEWAHASHAFNPFTTGASKSKITASKTIDALRTRRFSYELCPDLPAGLDYLRLRVPSPYTEDSMGIFVVCFRDEKMMMRAWARTLRAVQPDTIKGHNTTFDYGYMYARSALIFGERLPVQIETSTDADEDLQNLVTRATAKQDASMQQRVKPKVAFGDDGGGGGDDVDDEDDDASGEGAGLDVGSWIQRDGPTDQAHEPPLSDHPSNLRSLRAESIAEHDQMQFDNEIAFLNRFFSTATVSGSNANDATTTMTHNITSNVALADGTSPADTAASTQRYVDRRNVGYTSSDFFWMGRMIFDTTPAVVKKSATGANGARRELYPPMPSVTDVDSYTVIMSDTTLKYDKYTLSFLAQTLLGDDKIDLPPDAINARFRGSTDTSVPCEWSTTPQGLEQLAWFITTLIGAKDPLWQKLWHMFETTLQHDAAAIDLKRMTPAQRCRLVQCVIDRFVVSVTDADATLATLPDVCMLQREQEEFLMSWPWNALVLKRGSHIVYHNSDERNTNQDAWFITLERSYYDISAYCMHDTDCCLGLVAKLKILEQAFSVGYLTESPSCIALRRGVQYRIFNMVCGELYRRNIVLSRPIDLEAFPLEGACVINPVSGLYDETPVNTQDYAAMYPSNIQDKNLCFTTIFRPIPVERAPLPLDSVAGTNTSHPASSTGAHHAVATQHTCPLATRYIIPSNADLCDMYGAPTYPEHCNTPRLRRYYDLLKPRSSAHTVVVKTGVHMPPVHVMQYDAKTKRGYRGVLPALVDRLKAARDKAKGDMKRIQGNREWWDENNQKWISESAAVEYAAFDSMQIAIKVITNAVYGFNGAASGPISCPMIACAITHFARIQLEFTKDFYECHYNHVQKHAETMALHQLPATLPVLHRGACCFDSEFEFQSTDRTSRPHYQFAYCPKCVVEPATSHESHHHAALYGVSEDVWQKYVRLATNTLPPRLDHGQPVANLGHDPDPYADNVDAQDNDDNTPIHPHERFLPYEIKREDGDDDDDDGQHYRHHPQASSAAQCNVDVGRKRKHPSAPDTRSIFQKMIDANAIRPGVHERLNAQTTAQSAVAQHWNPLEYPYDFKFHGRVAQEFHITSGELHGRSYWEYYRQSASFAGLRGSNDPTHALGRDITTRSNVHRAIETIQCLRRIQSSQKPKKPKKDKAVYLVHAGNVWDEVKDYRHYWPPGAPPPALRPIFRNPALNMQIIYGDTDSVMQAHYHIPVYWTLNAEREHVGTKDTLERAIKVGRDDGKMLNTIFAKLDMAPAISLTFEKLYLPFWIGAEKKMYVGVKYEEPTKYSKVEKKTIGRKRDTYALVLQLLERIIRMIMLEQKKDDVMNMVRTKLETLIAQHSEPANMALFVKTKALRQHAYATTVDSATSATPSTKPIILTPALGDRNQLALFMSNASRVQLESRQTRVSNAGRRVPVHTKDKIFTPVAKTNTAKLPAITDHASANARYEAEFPGESYQTGARIPIFVRFDPAGYRKFMETGYDTLMRRVNDKYASSSSLRFTMQTQRHKSMKMTIPPSVLKTSELTMVLDHWEKLVTRHTQEMHNAATMSNEADANTAQLQRTRRAKPLPSPDMRYYIDACACLLTKLLVCVPGFEADFFERLSAKALRTQYDYHNPQKPINVWMAYANSVRKS